jgi:hypothetical protein
MAVRPLIEIRIDLIDSLSALGVMTRSAAIGVADQIIDAGGNARTPLVSFNGPTGPMGVQGFGFSMGFPTGSQLGAIGFQETQDNFRYQNQIRSQLGATGFQGPTGASIPLMELVPGPSFPATRAELRRLAGGLPMWKDGPPIPGWLVPGLLLARRGDDLLYRVTTLSDKVDFKRLMDMPGKAAYATEYRNLHKSWLATDFILCDECRGAPENETICEHCASRKLRKTGATRWELPKYCTVAYDDPKKPPPTRFEREEVI